MKIWLPILLLVLLGCEAKPSAPNTPDMAADMEITAEGDFFGAGLLEDSVELGGDFSVVPCVGATAKEQADLEHPRLIRGQALAPFGQLVYSPFPEWLVPSAHAVPVEGENTVSGANVRLYLSDAEGNEEKELGSATSDALGRFCFKLASGIEFGPRVVLEVATPNLKMRASVLSRGHSNVNVLSEAIFQIALQEKLLQDSMRARLINLHTYADTGVDIISPLALVDGEGVETAVKKVVDHLREDERFAEHLKN